MIPASVSLRIQRTGLVAAMVLATVNIWTGAPALGLWVGSRVAPSSGISMLAVATIAVTMGTASYLLVRTLGWLGAAHNRLCGHESTIRRHTPWLRSMSGERRPELGGTTPPLTAIDYVVITVVVACVIAFEAWFLLFSSSPLDDGTGRG